jgi:hypothetical protein
MMLQVTLRRDGHECHPSFESNCNDAMNAIISRPAQQVSMVPLNESALAVAPLAFKVWHIAIGKPPWFKDVLTDRSTTIRKSGPKASTLDPTATCLPRSCKAFRIRSNRYRWLARACTCVLLESCQNHTRDASSTDYRKTGSQMSQISKVEALKACMLFLFRWIISSTSFRTADTMAIVQLR